MEKTWKAWGGAWDMWPPIVLNLEAAEDGGENQAFPCCPGDLRKFPYLFPSSTKKLQPISNCHRGSHFSMSLGLSKEEFLAGKAAKRVWDIPTAQQATQLVSGISSVWEARALGTTYVRSTPRFPTKICHRTWLSQSLHRSQKPLLHYVRYIQSLTLISVTFRALRYTSFRELDTPAHQQFIPDLAHNVCLESIRNKKMSWKNKIPIWWLHVSPSAIVPKKLSPKLHHLSTINVNPCRNGSNPKVMVLESLEKLSLSLLMNGELLGRLDHLPETKPVS